jgi:transposase-like protein
MHASKRREKITMTSGKSENKTTVMGLVERGGQVMGQVIPDTKIRTMIPIIVKHVDSNAKVYTDAYRAYRTLKKLMYDHQSVDHSQGEYVVGDAHTNTIENFWSLLKRTIKGTYIQIASFHVNSYIVEQAFRYNTRKETDAERFERAIGHIFGKRLKYKDLIARKYSVARA